MSEDTGRAEGKPPHLDRLSGLWRRVAERKIVQWGVAYVALALSGIQHGVVLTGEAFSIAPCDRTNLHAAVGFGAARGDGVRLVSWGEGKPAWIRGRS